MRKLIWCCSAAGVLAAGSFLSLTYYACRCPDSLVGRSMQVIAEASLAMQPLSGLTSLAMRASQADSPPRQSEGSVEECIPDDPQPVAPEQKEEVVLGVNDIEAEAAPIVIDEDDPMPREQAAQAPPATIDITGVQNPEVVAKGCPIVMPYCRDTDDEPMTPPIMPGADAGDDKPVGAGEKKAGDASEEKGTVFKEWMKLFEAGKEEKSPPAEQLPAPMEGEEPQAEPKCQEDSHLHEHYSGCPRVTCPYTGKSYPSCPPATKTGKEESSEEPPQHGKKSHPGKGGKDKDECPRTQGVDTMEYRSSDAGLNEYGPGPLH
jgi:hypothetical protein